MSRLLSILIFSFCISIFYAQQDETACLLKTEFDSIKSVKKLEKEYKRYSSKTKFAEKKAQIAFVIGNRCRLLQDTACNYWYAKAIDGCKDFYTRAPHSASGTKTLYIMSLSHYHLNKFTDAQNWLSKLIKSKAYVQCGYYYLALTDLKLNDYKAALAEFENYRSEGGTINVDAEIATCKQHL